MPQKPKRACRFTGCPLLTSEGYCATHKKRFKKDVKNKSTSERGYGWDWQKLRKYILNLIPFCTMPDCFRFSTELDHVDGNKENLDPSNLRPYCTECHAKKTKEVDILHRMTWQEWTAKYPMIKKGIDNPKETIQYN